ncbi:MAG: rhodanese-like domain-containing protein [Anaerolineae bacterium]|nr:rhodanese-like domain-containing protein [Anaerolineae bacterium]
MLAVVLLLGLAACGGSDGDKPASAPTVTSAEGGSAQNPAKPTTYATLSVQAAYEQLSASADAQFVDVREASEAAATGLPAGASLISLGQFEQRAPKNWLKTGRCM